MNIFKYAAAAADPHLMDHSFKSLTPELLEYNMRSLRVCVCAAAAKEPMALPHHSRS